MENKIKIAQFEHCGVKSEVQLGTLEFGNDIRRLVYVETMGKTYELELVGGFGKLDKFLKELSDVVCSHDLAGGPEDVTDFIDEHIAYYDEYVDEAVPVYLI